MISDPTEQEIRQSLFSIRDQKALRSDGFSSKSFKYVWDTIKADFVDAILEFFHSGKLLKQWNHTQISLVRKIVTPARIADYKLIACCNVLYKVIFKTLAAQIATVAEHLLNPMQTAFVKGRTITGNVHLAQELLRSYIRKQISPRCMLKVDLSKAFDSVHWDFLLEVFQGL